MRFIKNFLSAINVFDISKSMGKENKTFDNTSNKIEKMKRIHQLFIVGMFFLVGCSPSKENQEISISSLLEEMVDRDQIANFPKSNYKSLQASSYNRESVSPDKPGWFADSDGIGFIRTEENNGKKEWVIMEDDGPGVITKIWAVCFYYGLNNTTGANIKFYLDGATEPAISTNFFKLVKGEAFVKPPFAQESTRAGNLYFPIPYAKSCKITMDDKAFYNIINYRKYPATTKVKTFTMEDFNETVALQEKIGIVLNTKPSAKGISKRISKELQKGEKLNFPLPKGNHAIKQLEIKVSNTTDIGQALRSVVLVGNFDKEQTVFTPVGDFFNNVGKVHPYEMWERSVKKDGTMICRWTMPYESTGEIYLENLGENSVKAELSVIVSERKWTKNTMHFHSTWRMDAPTPTFPLYDWNFLEAEGKGVIVGDEWGVLNPREGWWGEGDEKIYIDEDIEKNFPSHFGTGTEDYYGWAGGKVPTPADEFSNLFVGNIIVANPKSMGYNVCTRTRVLDAIPFQQKIKFDFESSCGTRQTWHRLQYAQTTFWYAIPGVKHNRKQLKKQAAAKLTTLEELQEEVEKAKKEVYVIDNALEAEILKISDQKGVVEKFSKIPMWGEISNGAMKNMWFEKQGDFVEFNITEQFEKSILSFGAAVGKLCGNFDIYVNGKLKKTQDFYSEHPGITNPYVALGACEPLNNTFKVKFVFKGISKNKQSIKGKKALGLDFFLINNNFLNR